MRISICGSMSCAKKIYKVYEDLIAKGHQVFLPENVEEFAKGELGWELGSLSREKGAKLKRDNDLIRGHYERIKQSDAVLIVNCEKKGIKSYIGANTLLEMGFAYVLKKKIYLFNNIPDDDYLLEEVTAMEPISINKDLDKIA